MAHTADTPCPWGFRRCFLLVGKYRCLMLKFFWQISRRDMTFSSFVTGKCCDMSRHCTTTKCKNFLGERLATRIQKNSSIFRSSHEPVTLREIRPFRYVFVKFSRDRKVGSMSETVELAVFGAECWVKRARHCSQRRDIFIYFRQMSQHDMTF